MAAVNADIAEQLNEIADLLEISGANPFRIRAYRKAARVVAELPRNVAEMLDAGTDLDDLPGIGPDLAGKIAVLARTGHITLLDQLERDSPPALRELLALPGLGPKRVRALHDALGITTLDELAEAAHAGRIHSLPGFSSTMEQKLLRSATERAGTPRRTKRFLAEQVAEALLKHIVAIPGVAQAEVAGSYRRRTETVGDLDIVLTARDAAAAMTRCVGYGQVARILAEGGTRSTVVLKNGMQVDFRVVPEASYGAALCYFTGSKAHNIALRQIALDRGLKLNEYGLFEGERVIAGLTEAEIYLALGLPYIEPELREDEGELDAARQGRLPRLITLGDVRGDLHAHTKASDGELSVAEMAAAARAKGYAYLAITDHSPHIAVTGGQDADRLAGQLAEIDRLNAGEPGIQILKGAEVDILRDGTLDLPDAILERLDLVVGAVHSDMRLPAAQQTERILRALRHPRLAILAHPTGRLIGERAPLEADLERILREAAGLGCCLEINAQPDRLDLTAPHCRMARGLGVKLAISTDAHSGAELDFMRFGVDQARRGWLEAGDVVNTRSWPALKRLLRAR